MEDAQVIVTLTRRNLELQEELDNLRIEYDDAIQARDNLNGHIADIQKALDYYGHPGNIAGVIRGE